MAIDLSRYHPPTNPELHFIQNDADCPLPAAGPGVTVGYWCATKAELAAGPDCEGDPLFTIVYPVGRAGRCYGWKHMTSDAKDPVHPNSASGIVWTEGHLRLTQFTTLDCSGPPHEKALFWVKTRDFPPELFARILSTTDIPIDGLREGCPVTLRACDGHYAGLDRTSGDAAIWCNSRQADESCSFKVAYPGYVWSEEGGQGDRGSFALRASNHKYLARSENERGEGILKATAQRIDQACLFTCRFSREATVCLLVDGTRLRHTPPGSELVLAKDARAPWTEFSIAYR